MKRISLLLAVIALTGMSAGVVGGPNASDGEMTITSGGSASATQSVGPNGTMWRTQINNVNNSCMSGNISQGMDFGNFTDLEEGNMTEITFSGVLSTSNPCQRVSLDVRDAGNVSSDGYVVEFVEKSDQGVCVSCVGAARFEGSFAAPREYRVVFENEGEELATRMTPSFSDSGGEENPYENSSDASVSEGILSILSWFSSLF